MAGDNKHVEQQFDQVLGQQRARQVPGELRLVVLKDPPRDRLGVAEVDLGTGRTGSANGDAAELQFRGGRAGTFLDQVKRECLRTFVLLFLKHLKSIDDGANRADEIVAHARTPQGGKISSMNSILNL
jgi:hypothetical protein